MAQVRNNKVVLFILIVVCIIGSIYCQELVIVGTQPQTCITPNGQNSICSSIYSCPELLSALISENESAIEFVRQSQCTTFPLVCCGRDTGFDSTRTTNNETIKTNVLIGGDKVLSDPRACGLQHTDDIFYNVSNAPLDEFPWIALIKYKHVNGEDGGFNCGGSLISERYVLTAGHCLRPHDLVPIGVRLGGVNGNKNVDCVTNPDDLECNDVALYIEIQEVIVHENYSVVSANNDIGLVRLNKTVQFTYYVHPICLPLPGTRLAEIGELMFSFGFANPEWKETGILERKIRSKVELVSNEECLQFYNGTLSGKTITSGHMCGKQYDDVTCRGDSGVLMISRRFRCYQEGIVSFASGCGPATVTVYTRVSEYLNWMQNTMRP